MNTLLIVESPAKAKTLVKYLGANFTVKASMGHLRDLPQKKLGVDIEGGFLPVYQEIVGKDKIISELKSAAAEADMVYLATDPDREGEAISWHLKEMLGLSDAKARRVTFNEITKTAVLEAIKNPRDIDMQLVDAQQGRRILDRIVGYKLSPFLWRKVRRGLSAGRVQTVVTRLIVDREREIRAFNPEEYWSIDVVLEQTKRQFTARFYGKAGNKIELKTEDETMAVLSAIDGSAYTVSTIKNTKKTRRTAPPFITSSLQQEASRKLSMTAKRTMAVAQELYEGVGTLGGLITYMRTDSLRVADEAIQGARDYISSRFGSNFMPAKPKFYKSKKDAQDAHEAIRPTTPSIAPDDIRKALTPDQFKLYRLIWSRFIASQMSDAILDTMSIDIDCAGYIFRATGSVVEFAGFLSLYEESRDDEVGDEDTHPLPPLKEGDKPEHKKTEEKQHFTQPPPRFTEASLIKAMEERGIGRPSTYAPTISTIVDREYVVKENKALKPTLLGEAVTDLMVDKFKSIADAAFTAQMEDKLDEVESGKRGYTDILDEFYQDFDGAMQQAEKDLEKTKIKVQDEESDIPCPNCGKLMVIKSGRFGKFLACPAYPECKTTKPITEELGIACPVCGSKMLKKKSKSGYYYYACEKNPDCPFMTWDKPTEKKCPKCGGVVYKKYTKEEKKNLCYMPNCGWEEPLATKKKKAAEEGEEKPKRGRKSTKTEEASIGADGVTAEIIETPKATKKTTTKAKSDTKTAKKPAAKAKTGAKTTKKAPAKTGAKKTKEAVETGEKPKRGRKKAAETEEA